MPMASGVASRSARNDVTAVPKRKLAAPYASRPTTGFQTSCQTNAMPNFEMDGRAPSTAFQAMSRTSAVAPVAAAPAIACSSTSPR
jgi:hypothetical protein